MNTDSNHLKTKQAHTVYVQRQKPKIVVRAYKCCSLIRIVRCFLHKV